MLIAADFGNISAHYKFIEPDTKNILEYVFNT